MSEPVSSDTINSLAGKLADFAETLDDAERSALDQFFLQHTDVEGFVHPGAEGVVAQIGKTWTKPIRQQYLVITLENVLTSSY